MATCFNCGSANLTTSPHPLHGTRIDCADCGRFVKWGGKPKPPRPAGECTYTGKLIKVFVATDRYTAGILKASGDTIKFRTYSHWEEGDILTVSGRWIDDPKYGVQFDATLAMRVK